MTPSAMLHLHVPPDGQVMGMGKFSVGETAVTLEVIQQYKINAVSFISSARRAASIFA